MGESVQKKTVYSGIQIMTAKAKTKNASIYVHVVSDGVILTQVSYDIVPYARHLLPVRFFQSIS